MSFALATQTQDVLAQSLYTTVKKIFVLNHKKKHFKSGDLARAQGKDIIQFPDDHHDCTAILFCHMRNMGVVSLLTL